MGRSRPLAVVLHGVLDIDDRPDENDALIQAEAVAAALERLGCASEIMALDFDLTGLERLRARQPAVVFNLVEALRGNGRLAHLVAGALDAFRLSYTGAGADALFCSNDKTLAKRMMRAANIPTPQWSYDTADFDQGAIVIVKSVWEHASLGLDSESVVSARDAHRLVATRHARFGGRWFIERFIEGREFNLSILERADGPLVLPVAETLFVDYPSDRPRIVDYEAKWIDSGFAFHHTPRRFKFAPEDTGLLARLRALAADCWHWFQLSGYARVDFRVDAEGRPWILEINANPCLAPDAGLAAAAAEAGLEFDDVVAAIVESAVPGVLKSAAA